MADHTDTPAFDRLAGRYRLLLLAYPASYRSARGEEIVATLLEAARPGQLRPTLADAVDLIAAGLRRRLGIDTVAGLWGGLAMAAPVAVALAAGIAGFAWWRLEPVSDHYLGTALFGQFRTLGPVAYAAWLAAGLAWVICRRVVSRVVTGFAITVTAGLVPLLAVVTTVERPPLWVTMALTGFGVLAVAGSGPIAGAMLSIEDRLGLATGAVAVTLTTSAVMLATQPTPGRWDYYEPTIECVGAVVAATVVALAAVAGWRLRHGATTYEWLWAVVLLGLPAGWLGPFSGLAWAPSEAVVPLRPAGPGAAGNLRRVRDDAVACPV